MNVVLLLAAALLLNLHLATGHGTLTHPPPRGLLSGSTLVYWVKVIDKDAKRDYKIHFPSGDKAVIPGSGILSQKRAAAGSWTPFEPMNANFRWRAGVCGDDAKNSDHLRGGQYYHKGKTVATYKAGSVVNFEAGIAAHHNGFFEFHLCDVSKCGGDISVKCFTTPGACVPLERNKNKCDRRKSKRCGPIDPSYPSRWYLPCDEPRLDRMGSKGEMEYRLPKDFKCQTCVLHFYWTAANSCNPPGVVEYFNGPSRPMHWPNCVGQGGARRGWTSDQKTCGGERFPEEYYQCADVKIV